MIKITDHSQKLFESTFDVWSVPSEDYRDPMRNYLLHGYSPGSFFTSLLANNAWDAISHSHPANSIPALKSLVGWIRDYVPNEAKGSYEAVDQWVKMLPEIRRQLLENKRLIYPAETETFMILQGK